MEAHGTSRGGTQRDVSKPRARPTQSGETPCDEDEHTPEQTAQSTPNRREERSRAGSERGEDQQNRLPDEKRKTTTGRRSKKGTSKDRPKKTG